MTFRIATFTCAMIGVAWLVFAADESKREVERPAKAVLTQSKPVSPKKAPPKRPLDSSKKRIERPAKALVADAKPVKASKPLDRAKMRIQSPVKTAVAGAKPPLLKPAPRADVGKALIEMRPKHLLVEAKAPPKPPVDVSKDDIETPPKALLVKATDESAKKTEANRGFKKVSPGDVRWHKDFAAAVKASKVSGKPVLLFQLLGQLDDEFT